jgi:hypothetical protein
LTEKKIKNVLCVDQEFFIFVVMQHYSQYKRRKRGREKYLVAKADLKVFN